MRCLPGVIALLGLVAVNGLPSQQSVNNGDKVQEKEGRWRSSQYDNQQDNSANFGSGIHDQADGQVNNDEVKTYREVSKGAQYNDVWRNTDEAQSEPKHEQWNNNGANSNWRTYEESKAQQSVNNGDKVQEKEGRWRSSQYDNQQDNSANFGSGTHDQADGQVNNDEVKTYREVSNGAQYNDVWRNTAQQSGIKNGEEVQEKEERWRNVQYANQQEASQYNTANPWSGQYDQADGQVNIDVVETQQEGKYNDAWRKAVQEGKVYRARDVQEKYQGQDSNWNRWYQAWRQNGERPGGYRYDYPESHPVTPFVEFPGYISPGQLYPSQQNAGQLYPGQLSFSHQNPGQQSPVQPNPIQPNPIQQIPIQQNPGQQIPGQQNSGQQNLIQQNPIQQIPIQQNPGQHNSVQQYPVQQYPVQQYSVQQYPVQQYPVQQYPVQQYPVQQYPVQQSQSQQYPSQQNPVQQYPVQQSQSQQYHGQQYPSQQSPQQSQQNRGQQYPGQVQPAPGPVSEKPAQYVVQGKQHVFVIPTNAKEEAVIVEKSGPTNIIVIKAKGPNGSKSSSPDSTGSQITLKEIDDSAAGQPSTPSTADKNTGSITKKTVVEQTTEQSTSNDDRFGTTRSTKTSTEKLTANEPQSGTNGKIKKPRRKGNKQYADKTKPTRKVRHTKHNKKDYGDNNVNENSGTREIDDSAAGQPSTPSTADKNTGSITKKTVGEQTTEQSTSNDDRFGTTRSTKTSTEKLTANEPQSGTNGKIKKPRRKGNKQYADKTKPTRKVRHTKHNKKDYGDNNVNENSGTREIDDSAAGQASTPSTADKNTGSITKKTVGEQTTEQSTSNDDRFGTTRSTKTSTEKLTANEPQSGTNGKIKKPRRKGNKQYADKTKPTRKVRHTKHNKKDYGDNNVNENSGTREIDDSAAGQPSTPSTADKNTGSITKKTVGEQTTEQSTSNDDRFGTTRSTKTSTEKLTANEPQSGTNGKIKKPRRKGNKQYADKTKPTRKVRHTKHNKKDYGDNNVNENSGTREIDDSAAGQPSTPSTADKNTGSITKKTVGEQTTEQSTSNDDRFGTTRSTKTSTEKLTANEPQSGTNGKIKKPRRKGNKQYADKTKPTRKVRHTKHNKKDYGDNNVDENSGTRGTETRTDEKYTHEESSTEKLGRGGNNQNEDKQYADKTKPTRKVRHTKHNKKDYGDNNVDENSGTQGIKTQNPRIPEDKNKRESDKDKQTHHSTPKASNSSVQESSETSERPSSYTNSQKSSQSSEQQSIDASERKQTPTSKQQLSYSSHQKSSQNSEKLTSSQQYASSNKESSKTSEKGSSSQQYASSKKESSQTSEKRSSSQQYASSNEESSQTSEKRSSSQQYASSNEESSQTSEKRSSSQQYASSNEESSQTSEKGSSSQQYASSKKESSQTSEKRSSSQQYASSNEESSFSNQQSSSTSQQSSSSNEQSSYSNQESSSSKQESSGTESTVITTTYDDTE